MRIRWGMRSQTDLMNQKGKFLNFCGSVKSFHFRVGQPARMRSSIEDHWRELLNRDRIFRRSGLGSGSLSGSSLANSICSASWNECEPGPAGESTYYKELGKQRISRDSINTHFWSRRRCIANVGGPSSIRKWSYVVSPLLKCFLSVWCHEQHVEKRIGG